MILGGEGGKAVLGGSGNILEVLRSYVRGSAAS